MSKKFQILTILGLLFICFIGFIAISEIISLKQEAKDQKQRIAEIGSIQFEGTVVNTKTYNYGGRTYYLLCVRLDYSNTKTVYCYNRLTALKIKNGIATFAGGELDPYFGTAKYVKVNLNLSNKIIYNYKNGDQHEFPFTLDPMGLPLNSLNSCN